MLMAGFIAQAKRLIADLYSYVHLFHESLSNFLVFTFDVLLKQPTFGTIHPSLNVNTFFHATLAAWITLIVSLDLVV